MIKNIYVYMVAIALFSGASNAALIDFDTLPDGTPLGHMTPITTQYQSLGAVFQSNGGNAAHIFNDPGEATSLPNMLVGIDNFADIFLTFVNPSTGLATTANNVSVQAISVGHAEWTVTAKDLNGSTLETFVLQNLSGPVNGLGNQDLITFTSNNIASVDFIFTQKNSGDGIGIDDLSFNLASPVPLPASFWLLATGLFSLFAIQKKS